MDSKQWESGGQSALWEHIIGIKLKNGIGIKGSQNQGGYAKASSDSEGGDSARGGYSGETIGGGDCGCRGEVRSRSQYRQKVDLTKYIEEHRFLFDNVFDETTSNFEVRGKGA